MTHQLGAWMFSMHTEILLSLPKEVEAHLRRFCISCLRLQSSDRKLPRYLKFGMETSGFLWIVNTGVLVGVVLAH